ncbi:MAG: tetratricopeptide repeat protein [Candidatus Vecturithrix sp.]|nr:tetratricopeptide repeat protein [Candidatus Vecturithrix sp.]
MKKHHVMLSLLIALQLLIVFRSAAQESSETRFVEQLRQTFITACQCFDEKQYARAALIFAQLRGHYPQLQDYIQFFLAESYRNAERPEDALKELQQFLKVYPDHPLVFEAHFNAANLLVNLKRSAEALPLYQSLLSESALNQGELYYKLGVAYREASNPQQAVAALTQAVFFFPKHGFWQEARKQLDLLLKKHPDFAITRTEETL